MLVTLDELMEYTEQHPYSDREWRYEIVIKSPGCSAEDVARLRTHLPELPESYTGVIQRIQINGITLGGFGLDPGLPHEASLVDRLIECNSETFGMWPFIERCRSRTIACWEADPVAVVCMPGEYSVGQILMFNVGNPPAAPVVLADSFETFLLATGNLDRIRHSANQQDDKTRIDRFMACLPRLGKGGDYEFRSAWRVLAEAELS